MSRPLAPYPPGEEMRGAMGRVWALYDGAYDEIQVQIRERLAGHPHFGPLIRDLPVDEAQDAASRERLRAAMVDWDWEGYWDNTAERWMEGLEVLDTSYALVALTICQEELKKKPPEGAGAGGQGAAR